MLTLQEARPLFRCLRFWSNVNVFPFKVNIRSGTLIQFPRWKMALWRIFYLLAVLRCIHGLLDVFSTVYFRPDDIVLYHLPLQFDGIVLPSILHFPTANALFSNISTVAKLFNELYSRSRNSNSCSYRQWFKLNVTELMAIALFSNVEMVTKLFNELHSRTNFSSRRHLSKLNLTELIALGTCFCVIGGTLFYMVMIMAASSMSHLLINSSLLATYRDNVGVVILAYFLELYAMAMWAGNVGFLLSMCALVIAKVQEQLNGLMSNLRRCESIEQIQDALKTSRRVQLYLQLYNGYNAWFVHAVKTNAILAAIVHGYFGVRFRNDLILASFCFFVHVGCSVAYCGAFQRAYQIVAGQRAVVRETVAASRRVRNLSTRRKLLQEVKSLRCIGLKVGSFHEIERNSSLIFLDFVETQLTSILVAF